MRVRIKYLCVFYRAATTKPGCDGDVFKTSRNILRISNYKTSVIHFIWWKIYSVLSNLILYVKSLLNITDVYVVFKHRNDHAKMKTNVYKLRCNEDYCIMIFEIIMKILDQSFTSIISPVFSFNCGPNFGIFLYDIMKKTKT